MITLKLIHFDWDCLDEDGIGVVDCFAECGHCKGLGCRRCQDRGYVILNPAQARRLQADREAWRLYLHGQYYLIEQYGTPEPESIRDFWTPAVNPHVRIRGTFRPLVYQND